jgi:hypothetical protein
MDEAKKAVGYAAALAEKYPRPETLVSSKLAIKAYAEAVDWYTTSIRKLHDANVVHSNATVQYYESLAKFRYLQGKNAR